MKLRSIILTAFFVFVAQVSFAQVKTKAKFATAKTEQVAKHRIVYDVVSADSVQQGKILQHLDKMMNHWPDAQIEMVVHGKGLDMLVKGKSVKPEQLKTLQDKGVVFAACENAMRAHKVSKESLLPGIITVPMGIVEIIEKQEAGYSYIKL
jgi:uncharacterized protein